MTESNDTDFDAVKDHALISVAGVSVHIRVADLEGFTPGWTNQRRLDWLHNNRNQIQTDMTEIAWESIKTLLAMDKMEQGVR